MDPTRGDSARLGVGDVERYGVRRPIGTEEQWFCAWGSRRNRRRHPMIRIAITQAAYEAICATPLTRRSAAAAR